MIKCLYIENFKAFSKFQKVNMAPITLIYGPNSGGKSSLIQSLMLMKQSFGDGHRPSSKLIPRGELVDLGTFKSILHGHNTRRKLQIGVTYQDMQGGQIRRYPHYLPRSLERTTLMGFQSAREPGTRRQTSSELVTVTYNLGRQSLSEGFALNLKRVNEVPTALLGRSSSPVEPDVFTWADDTSAESFGKYLLLSARRRTQSPREVVASEGGKASEDVALLPEEQEFLSILKTSYVVSPGLLPRVILTPDGENIRFVNATRAGVGSLAWFLDSFTGELAECISKVSYLGPLRSHPARHYLRYGGRVETVGSKGENTPQVIVSEGKEIKQQINRWFSKFDIPYLITPRHFGNETAGEIISINLVDKNTKVEVAPSDVGFGIGQLLPIIVEGFVSRNRTICVEQPEIHLHPRLQAHLADFLISTSVRAESERSPNERPYNNQWIIETHSESLMLRLQRRIKEGVIRPSDVSVVYVEPSQNGTGSKVHHLALDDDGEFIDEWPDGFFEESYDEVFF